MALTIDGSDPTGDLGDLLDAKLPIAGGKILQIVRATDATNRTTTSTSFVDITGMSVTITPQKSDSAILVMASFSPYSIATNGAINNSQYGLTDSSNNSLIGAQACNLFFNHAANAIAQLPTVILWGYSTPATVSATTYKARFRSAASTDNTTGVANADARGQMYAIEVSA